MKISLSGTTLRIRRGGSGSEPPRTSGSPRNETGSRSVHELFCMGVPETPIKRSCTERDSLRNLIKNIMWKEVVTKICKWILRIIYARNYCQYVSERRFMPAHSDLVCWTSGFVSPTSNRGKQLPTPNMWYDFLEEGEASFTQTNRLNSW